MIVASAFSEWVTGGWLVGPVLVFGGPFALGGAIAWVWGRIDDRRETRRRV